MAYWIKINYERDNYVLDLAHISAFACADNGRLTFWLPDSGIPIIINQQSHSKAYQQVLDYIKQVSGYSPFSYWIKINYDRSEYVIDLDQISSFTCTHNGRLSFCLPNSGAAIIIHQQSHPETYQKVLDYVEKKTGHSLL